MNNLTLEEKIIVIADARDTITACDKIIRNMELDAAITRVSLNGYFVEMVRPGIGGLSDVLKKATCDYLLEKKLELILKVSELIK